MEEQSYTSTHPVGHNRASNGNTLTFFYSGKVEERSYDWIQNFMSKDKHITAN
jgi:hypothetical protein